MLVPLTREARARLGEGHAAAVRLHAALGHLAVGAHGFHATQKRQAYKRARDTLAIATADFVLDGRADALARR